MDLPLVGEVLGASPDNSFAMFLDRGTALMNTLGRTDEFCVN